VCEEGTPGLRKRETFSLLRRERKMSSQKEKKTVVCVKKGHLTFERERLSLSLSRETHTHTLVLFFLMFGKLYIYSNTGKAFFFEKMLS